MAKQLMKNLEVILGQNSFIFNNNYVQQKGLEMGSYGLLINVYLNHYKHTYLFDNRSGVCLRINMFIIHTIHLYKKGMLLRNLKFIMHKKCSVG